MRTLPLAVLMGMAAGAAVAAAAEAPAPMPALAPADAKALVEVRNAAALRESLLGGRFWALLEGTQAAIARRSTDQYRQAEERLEKLLARLGMTRREAMRAYFGGASALVVLPGAGERPPGVLLTETTKDLAVRLVEASGGAEAGRHRDVTLWEVRGEERTSRLAYAGGVLLATESEGDALEHVLDTVVGGGASLQADGRFAAATAGLPPDWRVRAYAADTKPHGGPGAATFYPWDEGRVRAEWQMLVPADAPLGAALAAANEPVRLTGPAILPAGAVAAVATALHPPAIWDLAKAKAAAEENGPTRLRRAEMMIRAWFPGESLEAILGAFGPEAAMALVPPEGGAAKEGAAAGAPPALVAMVRIRQGGDGAALAFKKGLEAKALLLAALADDTQPRLDVRNESYGDVSLLIIEAPEALTNNVLGDLGRGSALTVAIHEGWLIAGTAPGAVKAVLAAASGRGAGGLAAALADSGAAPPAGPVTRWGAVRPVGGADLILRVAEQLAGREKLEEADRLVNLAELMDLVKQGAWQRTDGPGAIRGSADLQVIH